MQLPTLEEQVPTGHIPGSAATARECLATIREAIRVEPASTTATTINKRIVDSALRCPRSLLAPSSTSESNALTLGNLVDIAHQLRASGVEIGHRSQEEWAALSEVSGKELGAQFEYAVTDNPAWFDDALAHIASLDAMLPTGRPWFAEVAVQAALGTNLAVSMRLDGLIRFDGVGCVVEIKTGRSNASSSLRDRAGDLMIGALLASATFDLDIGAAAILVTQDGSIETHRISDASFDLAAQRLTDAALTVLRSQQVTSLLEIPAQTGNHCRWCSLSIAGPEGPDEEAPCPDGARAISSPPMLENAE